MIGKLICWWKGKHLRGKCVGAENDGSGEVRHFECPRCKAKWSRQMNRKTRKVAGVATIA